MDKKWRARVFEGNWAPRDPHVLSWVWKRTLITEFEYRFSFIELTFGRMPIITKWSRAITFHVIPARLSSKLPRTQASETLSSRCTSAIIFVPVAQRMERTFGVGLRAYPHRVGIYDDLLSNTVLLLSIDNILLVLFQHPRWPLRFVTTAPDSILSFLVSKFRNRSFWSILLFTMVFNLW